VRSVQKHSGTKQPADRAWHFNVQLTAYRIMDDKAFDDAGLAVADDQTVISIAAKHALPCRTVGTYDNQDVEPACKTVRGRAALGSLQADRKNLLACFQPCD